MSSRHTTRTSRQTGARIRLVDNRDGRYADDGHGWWVECQTHGAIDTAKTRKQAERMIGNPAGWCNASSCVGEEDTNYQACCEYIAQARR